MKKRFVACVIAMICLCALNAVAEGLEIPLPESLQEQTFVFDELGSGTGTSLYTLIFSGDGYRLYQNEEGGLGGMDSLQLVQISPEPAVVPWSGGRQQLQPHLWLCDRTGGEQMKKLIAILAALCMMASMAVCAEEAPAGMQFSMTAAMLVKAGDAIDLSLLLENPAEDVIFTSSDELVATVDDSGVVTAAGEGVATIVAVSESDTSVYAYMDVAVYNYLGIYAGSKHVDAMGCDIDVEIVLNADGTFAYTRGPMSIALEGGGEMPAMDDAGTYAINGNEIAFTAEQLGEFSAAIAFVDGAATLQGKLPTGGPSTDMDLIQTRQAAPEEAVEEVDAE